MKLLIIGANGMLGSMLSQTFSDLNPVCWDRDDLDITDAEAVREKLSEVRPDVVINAAAYTDVDAAEEHEALARSINEDGVRNLAQGCLQIDAVLVHYSTDYVFPGDKETGYTEEDSPGPAVNMYGDTKLAGERALVEVKPKFYLLRTAWLYGPGGKNFVTTMLELAKTRDQLAVVDDQFGSPTFTKDVAQFTREILEHIDQYPFGIYHAVNAGRASWFDFASKIFQYSNMTLDVKRTDSSSFPRPAKRPAFSILHNTKGPAMRPWEDALAEYLR